MARLVQLLTRYIGMGLVALFTWIGASTDNGEASKAAEMVASGIGIVLAVLLDHLLHRVGESSVVGSILGKLKNSDSVKLLLMLMILPAFTGCSFLAPGEDTRKAAEARSETTWDANSNLSLKEDTTHNRRVVMVENSRQDGEPVSVEYYADGTPKKITGGTQVLTQCSEPKDVMQGYMLLAQKNAEVAGKMLDTVDSVLRLYSARGAPAATSDALSLPNLMTQWESLTPEQQDKLLGLVPKR